MGRIKRFRTIIKQKGIKSLFSHISKKITGVYDCQEQIDTLYYFLNHSCDITQYPKATGNLRQLQEADTLLLAIVDKVLRKHNIEYWLDAGTLLGAVRHKGFIPWDDDLDICIFREDFYKTIDVLNRELNEFGINAWSIDTDPGWAIKVGYKYEVAGIWLDIFPADFANIDKNNQKIIDELQSKCKKYYKKWDAKKKSWSLEEEDRQRRKYINAFCSKEEANLVLYNVESEGGWALDINYVLPTKAIQFESFYFKAPNSADHYLKKKYGNTFMDFPKWGVNHHENIQDLAEKSGINLEETIAYLNSIQQKI